MSRSNKNCAIRNDPGFLTNEKGWADFFITRIGLILFAAMLLLSAFKVYPMFQASETRTYLDVTASEIASKIEAVDVTTIPEIKHTYVFDGKNKVRVEMSTEYVVTRMNMNAGLPGERELFHAEPVVTHVYLPNSNWSNTSGLREYISQNIGGGRNGAPSYPLDLSNDKEKVDSMFNNISTELARTPFIPDTDRPLIIEKVIISYTNQTETVERDYVLVYQ